MIDEISEFTGMKSVIKLLKFKCVKIGLLFIGLFYIGLISFFVYIETVATQNEKEKPELQKKNNIAKELETKKYKVSEEEKRATEASKKEEILRSLGPLRCSLRIRWTVTENSKKIGNEIRKYDSYYVDEESNYIEVSIYSIVKDRSYNYRTGTNFSKGSTVELSYYEGFPIDKDFDAASIEANKCLSEFFERKRTALDGNISTYY